MRRSCVISAIVLALLSAATVARAQATSADVVVYEGTPSGVMAAVAAARHGSSVILVEMNNHLGGVVSGGLIDSDMGDRDTVGGLANEFFTRILKHYVDTYGPGSEQVKACQNGKKFEPHVAEQLFETMIAEQSPRITIWKHNRLNSITQDDHGNITSIATDDLADHSTRSFTGKMFIDASYEGDLMAAAKVPCRIGREARSEYGETVAGVSVGPEKGNADDRLMAYNYRVCITSDPNNAVPFPKPAHYDPSVFVDTDGKRIIDRNLPGFAYMYSSIEGKACPNQKYDSNWCDLAGLNAGYADGDWAKRQQICDAIRDHFLSRLWYLQNDPSLPKAFHDDAQHWGLAKDEFADNGNFPFQLYVREARRMVGQYVLTENDITQDRYKADGICEGSYGVDCHEVQRLQIDGRRVMDAVHHVDIDKYDIPYGCLVPRAGAGQPGNLLVPVCCSASHVAYCSLRMEPVYMMLGQAAGTAAELALASHAAVQAVDVKSLRDVLTRDGARLDPAYQPQVRIAFLPAKPKVGEPVSFSMLPGELRDPIVHVWWSFDGDGIVSAEGPQAQHTFALDKISNVSLIVEDAAGRRRMINATVPVGTTAVSDITQDDFDIDLAGRWEAGFPKQTTRGNPAPSDVWLGPGNHHDLEKDGQSLAARATFSTTLPRAGSYEVCFAYRPDPKQASNLHARILHAGEKTDVTIDETKNDSPFPFVPLGTFNFTPDRPAVVEINNHDANGRVTIDAVRWVWKGDAK